MNGVNLTIVDLFPPTKRDPNGVHDLIVQELFNETFILPDDQPFTLVGYDAKDPMTAYIETLAVGDTLPEIPLFLKSDFYVNIPLEKTYLETWLATPKPVKDLLA